MKKLLSLFVPLMALMLTLAPQTAKADYVDDNLIKPLTIEKTATTSINLKFYRAAATSGNSKVTINLQYRYYKNGAWSAWTNVATAGTTTYAQLYSNSTAATLLNGVAGKIQLRGINPTGFSKSSSDYYQFEIISGASPRPSITISGNIMSLIVGYDTDNETTAQATLAAADEIPSEYCFYKLFPKITSASMVPLYTEELIFPATKLKSHCYESMFDGLVNSSYGLYSAPTFLATDFKDKDGNDVSSSFARLCYGCSNFTNIHVNFRNCYAAGENNLTNWLNGCSTKKTIYAPEAFRTCANNNSGNSDAVWNGWTKTDWSKDMGPSTHTVTIESNNTDYGTVDVASVASVPHGTTITTSTNTINVNGTTVTATPTTSTAQYTYALSNWTNGTATVNADLTVTANFTRTLNQYTITWKSEDGSETLETDADQNYGTTTAFNGATPTKAATAQYTYTFDGWATSAGGEKVYNNGETPAVGGAATYYAHFSATTNNYTVSIVSSNAEYGTVDVASVASVPYGTTITTGIGANANKVTINETVVSATPTASTAEYTYTFDSWTNGTATVTGNLTVTANFSRTANNYTLTWVTDGDELTGDYTSGTVAYGTAIVAPNTPTKTGYTFASWTPAVAETMPAATTTYTAQWTAKTSTVTLNANGGTGSDQTVTATYDASMPLTTTASTALVAPKAPAGKTFRGYYDTDASSGGTQYYTATLTSARTWDKETASVTLYARWTDIETVNLYDGEDYKDTYATTLSTYAGQTVNVVLKDRTFPAGQWNTISLPFSLATIEETPLDGRLYTITDVTVDNTNGMQIFFDAEDHVIAGKPYLLWIDELISDMRFDGVVMTTFTAGEFTTPSGYVKFKANIPWQKLTLKSQIFINNNRLYFPNQTNGTKMRSFRGYFEIQDANGMVYSPERVRIVARGKNGTTVEVKESDADDADLADAMEDSAVRKYIHHGILVIERNGVKYNAQGQVIVNN